MSLNPQILRDESVKRWLGGVTPVWTLLEKNSFETLLRPPHPTRGPIRLNYELSLEDIESSPVAHNTLILLRAASAAPGLKMTATGNLSRNVVEEMRDCFQWPGFGNVETYPFHRVINEPDFFPLFFVRHVAQSAQLLHKQKKLLKVTPAGRKVISQSHTPALQAILFHITMWHLDLNYLGRGLYPDWPHATGVVLWSMSTAAIEWQSAESLTRLCAIPIHEVLKEQRDMASYAMEARILRPLLWFGLLDHKEDDIPAAKFGKKNFYRKTELFDRFLSFDIKIGGSGELRH